MKKRKNSFLSMIALGLIFVLVVGYSGYHIVSLLTNQDVRTIVSGVTAYQSRISGTGYVFRDETLLRSQNTGNVDYLVGDGEIVRRDDAVARVYPTGDAASQSMLEMLDRQISLIERGLSDTGADVSGLRREAENIYYKLLESISSRSGDMLYENIDKMTVEVNRIDAFFGKREAMEERLEGIKARRSEIFEGEPITETASTRGYFYRNFDGFEPLFSMSALETLDYAAFSRLIGSISDESTQVDATIYGKIAESPRWSLVVPIDPSRSDELVAGRAYDISFAHSAKTYNMHLQRIIVASSGEKTLCVFSGSESLERFERGLELDIELEHIEGIYVPDSAMTTLDGIRGVYVLKGSVVYFRCVEIVYDGDGYCLVKEDAENVGKYYSLGKNELIVTNGKNFFHERILD